MKDKTPEAGILITVTRFVPVGEKDFEIKIFSDATVKLIGNANGRVSQAGSNGPIRVDRGAVVDLVFALAPGSSKETSFFPVGISFFGVDDGDLGMDDFPKRTVSADAFNGMTLAVHDANTGGHSFKFSLVIQRQSDGALGVIDPHVNNA